VPGHPSYTKPQEEAQNLYNPLFLPTFGNPFSLTVLSPSLPISTSPASTSQTEPATEPEADVVYDVEEIAGKSRKIRARVLKK